MKTVKLVMERTLWFGLTCLGVVFLVTILWGAQQGPIGQGEAGTLGQLQGLSDNVTTGQVIDKSIVIPTEITKVQKFKTASCPAGYEGHYISGSWEEQSDVSDITASSGTIYATTAGFIPESYKVCVTKVLMDELRKQK